MTAMAFSLGTLAGLLAARLGKPTPRIGKVHHRPLGHHEQIMQARHWRERP
jgi:hypothetical protein